MAKVSKRKRPARDVKVFKEQIKVESSVFDRFTLREIYSLMASGIIMTLDFPIKKGKESIVFRATPPPGYPADFLAVKVYMVETSDFVHMAKYIADDPRFRVRSNKRKLIHEWVKKEYRNLLLCEKMGVPVPHPHAFRGNVLVMDFIGEDGAPAKTLKERGPLDPQRECDFLMGEIRKMHKGGFVHADLSEYNILCGPGGRLVLIDLAQGVLKGHPHYSEWLHRDVANISKYYRSYGANADVSWLEGQS
ncbi:MAG: serine protein kinase RIO [Candidatus Micrarchaeota archaeon]|nr:serine protein kinase RIO [Candidatus Micrarchaeota archaeon]